MNLLNNYVSCIETQDYQVWVCDEFSFLVINIIIIIMGISLVFLYPKLYDFIRGSYRNDRE